MHSQVFDNTSRPPVFDAQPVSDLVAAMAPISLDEMDRVRLMDRVDTKFVLGERQLRDLLEVVSSDYRVLEVDGARVAPYTTLYFDTPARHCYLAHHNGRANRHKYRTRNYGPNGPSFFEMKTKTNKGRTVKRRVQVTGLGTTIDGDAAAAVCEGSALPSGLGPQVWTSFSRITLVGNCLRERVTIDLGLRFWAPQGERMGATGLVIVEVKQPDRSYRSPLRLELRRMRVPPTRVSKYCVASALLDPSLKRNRFKSTLRAIKSLA